MRPAVYLPGQLERVKDTPKDTWVNWGAWSPASGKIKEVISTEYTQAATIAYRVKDAILFHGSIYSRNFRYPFHPKNENIIFKVKDPIVAHVQNAAVASTFLGTKYFGHWLADDCSRYLLAESYGQPICTRRSSYTHQAVYAECFKQDWSPTDRATIDNLTIFQDHGQNNHKRQRYEILKSRVRNAYNSLGSSGIVYFRRGRAGEARLIADEEKLIDTLSTHGVKIVDVSEPAARIINEFTNAKLVISIEGSHLTHYLYTAPEDGALLILQPADRFDANVRSWAGCVDLKVGFVVGVRSDAGYRFSPDEILKTIDLMGI